MIFWSKFVIQYNDDYFILLNPNMLFTMDNSDIVSDIIDAVLQVARETYKTMKGEDANALGKRFLQEWEVTLFYYSS